jgi:branched-chain amino acid transport system ATP-binding protein
MWVRKLLEIRNVDVSIEGLKILHNICLYIEKGEIVSLIGANGAGKTTLIKTIMRIIKHQKGEIIFSGQKLDPYEAYEVVKLGISLVPEGRRIFPYMTVYENLQIGAYVPTKRKEMKKHVDWVFSLFPILKERRNQLAGTLSGGEQQMLAIGRALISRPKLLLLDEISLGLSPKSINALYKTIKEINAEGVSILLVDQALRRALKFANRAYVIERGKIVWEGNRSVFNEDELRKKYFGLS